MADEHNPYDLDGNALKEKTRHEVELTSAAMWEADVRWLMGHRQGRRIVFKMMDEAKVFHTIFNANALLMAHSAGVKDLAFRFLDVINRRCPDLYTKMMQEHHDDRYDGTGVRTDSNS